MKRILTTCLCILAIAMIGCGGKTSRLESLELQLAEKYEAAAVAIDDRTIDVEKLEREMVPLVKEHSDILWEYTKVGEEKPETQAQKTLSIALLKFVAAMWRLSESKSNADRKLSQEVASFHGELTRQWASLEKLKEYR